ncbi:hypothetical protein AGMMS49928_00750 [Spirochaetia bacterium]|nr:hypothetical protein AGMMS49928_00750 [Spirochaetia bacterium]
MPAQEAAQEFPETEVETEAVPELSPEEKVLDMDIRTSTLLELAAWCRSLGLGEGGTREALISRLQNHFKIPAVAGGEAADKSKVIMIESARSTEYFTLEVVDEEYARLRGDVVVSLKDGEATHSIKAWEILYNRTRNIMTASGGVVYVKTEGDTIETFRGESITVNLDNWSSIFLDGISEHSISDNQTTYRFAGTVISRSDEEVTVLTRASVTNASNEEAYWSLNASKLWLLPGSDWAILNAVLKVGEIPVLWIPVFYYPADEIIFHPVLGYRSREGNFVQTTTYILGRPKSTGASENSITKILGSGANMEKEREGIFLRSTGKKYRDPNDTRFSILADVYANLGLYFGTELALPAKGIFGATDFSAGIGFTRDVVLTNYGFYTPFPQYDGTSEWNQSRLFFFETPFRYRINAATSVSGRYGSLSVKFPFYSDPYVDRDFLDRSEELDWLTMIKEGASREEPDTTKDNILGSYEWRLSGSLNPPLPSLAPYLSGFSISSFTSTLTFRTRESSKFSSTSVSPNRTFFYPDKFTLFSISASIAGNPLTVGGAAVSQNSGTAPAEDGGLLKSIGVPRSPWADYSEETIPANQGSVKSAGDSPPAALVPPAITQRFDAPRSGGPRFSIDYRLSPSAASDLQFNSDRGTTTGIDPRPNWVEIEDIDWGDVSTILTSIRSDASVGFTLSSFDGGSYTSAIRFSGSGSWQDYSYINEDAEKFLDSSTHATDPLKIKEARLSAYNSTSFTSSWENTTTVKPLYQDPVWGKSSFQYSIKGLLAKTKFSGDADTPDWSMEYGSWKKTNIETHQIGATVSANVMDHEQTLTVTTDLPPKDATMEGNATLRTWIFETNARQRIVEPWDEELRKLEPLYMTETVRWSTRGSVQQQVVYSHELGEFTSLTSSLTWGGLTASLQSIRSMTYRFDTVNKLGWVATGEEALEFRDFRIAYVGTSKKENLWGKRLSFSLNLNTYLNLDLQRYTYSRYYFSLGFTLGIAGFLDMALYATSENSVIFRYFHDWPFFADSGIDVGQGDQNNLFFDLINSFRFDDDALRRQSGFKLKSFNLDLTHHLGDWNAKLGLKLVPELDTVTYAYKFKNEISFVVEWIPIGEIKTEVINKNDAYTFR